MVKAVSTLSEVKKRADRLRVELEHRHLHPDVLRFCREDLIEGENCFHAVLEATKSVAQKLREKSGLALDGHALVDAAALALGKAVVPVVAFNILTTDTLRSEHNGIVSIMRGYVQRLPEPHRPRAQSSVQGYRGGAGTSSPLRPFSIDGWTPPSASLQI